MDLARIMVLAALGGCAAGRTGVETAERGTETVVAVRAGRLLDVRSGTLTEGAVLLVRRGVIVAVGREVVIPAGAEAIDATGFTVLPGMIDAHVHLTLGPAPGKALGGAELLKVCVTDWLDAAVQSPDSVELTEAELAAVAAVGRRTGTPLAAHAIGQGGVHAALLARVHLFAHTPVVDSATARPARASSWAPMPA
jgi:imidazolonepropionase-like amidohydrolase